MTNENIASNLSFKAKLENIVLLAIRDLFRRLGPIGIVLYFLIKSFENWTTIETREAIIKKYLLNIDKLPHYLSKSELYIIINFVLITILIITIFVFKHRERELRREVKRIGIEKTKLQENKLGPLEHSE